MKKLFYSLYALFFNISRIFPVKKNRAAFVAPHNGGDNDSLSVMRRYFENKGGYDLVGIKDKDIPFLRRKMGVVFQDFQLLMDRNVNENLRFVLSATGWKDERAISKRIASVLEAVGMERKAHKMPHQLSGGEQQRIAIARSLLNEPQVIIADEPTGNLDNETADGIMKLLTGINQENGTAIVMVTHNRQIFEKYPGRVMVCKEETCEEQDPDEAIDLELTI